MPPHQCPECGRFLKGDFVAALSADPTPCPRCETGLVEAMFAVASGADDAPASAPVTAPADTEPSVRPPDLAPDRVRDAPGEVLRGWDPSGPPAATDSAPFPMDAVVLAGAGLVGAVLGTLFGERGCRGAVLGAAGGVFGAAVARRVWRLE